MEFYQFWCKKKRNNRIDRFSLNVDSQGFEPQMTEPKSVVLPLHHESISV